MGEDGATEVLHLFATAVYFLHSRRFGSPIVGLAVTGRSSASRCSTASVTARSRSLKEAVLDCTPDWR